MRMRLSLVQLVFIPILFTAFIVVLANGIRELLIPEWQILIDYPVLILILAWLEILGIIMMSGFNIYCLIKLYYLITKFISDDKLEAELYRIKKK